MVTISALGLLVLGHSADTGAEVVDDEVSEINPGLDLLRGTNHPEALALLRASSRARPAPDRDRGPSHTPEF
ncbi:MAG: hypothetical protein EOO27_02100 [Comamonadaceae bacterium]|nr:MAG: hypothetical protein EOO27_02100 [Comamonadaceae bacterium]